MKKRVNKKNKVDIKQTLKLYWEISRKYKWYFFAIIFFITLANVSQLGEKFIFKILIDKGTDIFKGTLALEAFSSIVVMLAISYFILILFRSGSYWMRMHLINRVELRALLDLKRKFFNHILDLDYSFHTTHKTGSLISRIGRGSRALERLNDFLFFNMVPLLIQLIIVGIALYSLDRFSLLILISVAVVFVWFSIVYLNRVKNAEVIANNAEDKEKGAVSDFLTNISSIKYFGKEKFIKKKFWNLANNTKRKSLKTWDYYRWIDLGQTLIVALGVFTMLFISIERFLEGRITIGSVAFVYTLFLSFVGSLYGFVWGLRSFFNSLADFKNLFDYIKIKKEITDKPNAKTLKVTKGEIEFNNVTFSYHKKKVIKNLSLKIKPKEKIAIVGHSGSGKTTLIKLLYRLYDVDSGEIKVDGINVKDVKQESLRSELSIVPQECILFDDTIYNNILFSNPKASYKEVMNAIKLAKLGDFVKNLPKKEKTIVGERGIKLSGGEKQRVSIARAILANKRVLVLDEATSSLDSKTEHEIQEALDNLMRKKTSIIIAHRLSTIMRADRIVVMHKGRIVQIGTHRDLINKKGIYGELWNLQKGGYLK